MRMRHRVLATALVLVSSACGGSSSSKGVTNPNNTNKSMSARVDGTGWTAVAVAASHNNGLLIVSGANAASQAIAITASLNQGTGVQTIGPNGTSIGTITIGSTQWGATNFQGSGNVTLTNVSATRVVGTFAFTGPSLTAGATPATRAITSGVFDVTF
jgi:hypothetical protein